MGVVCRCSVDEALVQRGVIVQATIKKFENRGVNCCFMVDTTAHDAGYSQLIWVITLR